MAGRSPYDSGLNRFESQGPIPEAALQGRVGNDFANLSLAHCKPVSGNASDHFQEEEFYGQRPTAQLGAFGLQWPRPETAYRHPTALMHGNVDTSC
jgi:hypothetical protein